MDAALHRYLKVGGFPEAQETEVRDRMQLLRLVSMHTPSERQRLRNPRKLYPIDPGLIPVYERAGRENRGRSLETVVLIELEHRGYETGWVRPGEDLEVDFYAESRVGGPLLVQVSLDTASEATWEREIRALQAAAEAYPEARPPVPRDARRGL